MTNQAAASPAAPAAAEPAPAPAATEESNASGPSASDVELFNAPDEGEEEIVVKSAAAAPAAPAAPAVPAAAPAAPAAEPAKPAVSAKPADAPAPAAPAEPAKPAAVVAETPEQKTAREAQEKVEGEKLFQGLVKHYELPDDLAAQLPTEPEKVLPYMAAKVHETVVRAVQQMFAREVPQYIAMTQQMQAADKASKDAFYTAWPALAGHEQAVLKAGQLYRQLNPAATAEEAIKAIGGIVSQSLGISVVGAPAASAVPAAPLPTPAGGATGGNARPAATDKNEFTAMSLEPE